MGVAGVKRQAVSSSTAWTRRALKKVGETQYDTHEAHERRQTKVIRVQPLCCAFHHRLRGTMAMPGCSPLAYHTTSERYE